MICNKCKNGIVRKEFSGGERVSCVLDHAWINFRLSECSRFEKVVEEVVVPMPEFGITRNISMIGAEAMLLEEPVKEDPLEMVKEDYTSKLAKTWGRRRGRPKRNAD